MPTPRITVLTMGGTIAASAASPAATTRYALEAGVDPVRDLLAGLAVEAEIATQSIAHQPSHDLGFDAVRALAQRIAEIRAGGAADGIVVTHGTDTLEETAFLLDLVLAPGAPVVVTGAARPSSALSADGPLNLLHACRVVLDPEAAGRGILVCLNDRILAARHATKTHTSAPDTFRDPHGGPLGMLTGEEIRFHAAPRGGLAGHFAPGDLADLPRVEILYAHLGQDSRLVDLAIDDGAAGLVLAGTGNGSVAEALKTSFARARDKGVVVVRASRCASGAVSAGKADDELGTIPAGTLNPQKARLLLMLALGRGLDRDAVAALFARA